MASKQPNPHPFTLKDFLNMSGLTNITNPTTAAVHNRLRFGVNPSSYQVEQQQQQHPVSMGISVAQSSIPTEIHRQRLVAASRSYLNPHSVKFAPQGPDAIYLPSQITKSVTTGTSSTDPCLTSALPIARSQQFHHVPAGAPRSTRPGRPQLRRSNTVGAADTTTTTFTNDPSNTSMLPQYRVLSVGATGPHQIGRRLHTSQPDRFIYTHDINQFTRQQGQINRTGHHSTEHWYNPAIAKSIHTPALGMSPTERTVQRLTSTLPMNTGSLDRNIIYSSVNYGTNGTPLRSDGQEPLLYQYSTDSGVHPRGQVPRPLVGPTHSDLAGSATPIVSAYSGSYTSPISRRARLRREQTVDVGGMGLGSFQFTEPPNVGVQPQETDVTTDDILSSLDAHARVMGKDDFHGTDDSPDELYFTSEGFQGRALVQWLCRQLVRTGHTWTYNLITLVAQLCTALMRLGVLRLDHRQRTVTQSQSRSSSRDPDNRFRDLYHSSSNEVPLGLQQANPSTSLSENRSGERFDLNRFYQWSGQSASQVLQLLNRSSKSNETTAHSSRASQAEILGLRREYESELDRLTRDHELQLFRVKNQGVMKACQLTDRIEWLEQEVEKYRILAGIERLTRSPLMDDPRTPRAPIEKSKRILPSTGVDSSLLDRTDVTEEDMILDASRINPPFRFGYSVPDNNFQNNSPTEASRRNRALSDTTQTVTGPTGLIRTVPRSGHDDYQTNVSNPGSRMKPAVQESYHMDPVAADELPKTKGLLRRLKELGSSSGTDSGMGGSSKSGSGRLDSQDTAQHSQISTDLEDSIMDRLAPYTKPTSLDNP